MSGKADSEVSEAEHESLVGDSPSHLQQSEDEIVVINGAQRSRAEQDGQELVSRETMASGTQRAIGSSHDLADRKFGSRKSVTSSMSCNRRDRRSDCLEKFASVPTGLNCADEFMAMCWRNNGDSHMGAEPRQLARQTYEESDADSESEIPRRLPRFTSGYGTMYSVPADNITKRKSCLPKHSEVLAYQTDTTVFLQDLYKNQSELHDDVMALQEHFNHSTLESHRVRNQIDDVNQSVKILTEHLTQLRADLLKAAKSNADGINASSLPCSDERPSPDTRYSRKKSQSPTRPREANVVIAQKTNTRTNAQNATYTQRVHTMDVPHLASDGLFVPSTSKSVKHSLTVGLSANINRRVIHRKAKLCYRVLKCMKPLYHAIA
jgi:hypothetical protein